TLLQRQGQGDGAELGLAELAVTAPAAAPGHRLPGRGQQPELLAVAEHAGRGAEPPGGLCDAHAANSDKSVSESRLRACQRVPPDRRLTARTPAPHGRRATADGTPPGRAPDRSRVTEHRSPEARTEPHPRAATTTKEQRKHGLQGCRPFAG